MEEGVVCCMYTCVQVWQDGVVNAVKQPTDPFQWNARVKMVVNAWTGNRHMRAFDFANAGYPVKNSCSHLSK